MKKIVIKSTLKESEALKILKKISDDLYDKKLLERGDELVNDISGSDEKLKITLDIDSIKKPLPSIIKYQIQSLGDISEGAKFFDEILESDSNAKAFCTINDKVVFEGTESECRDFISKNPEAKMTVRTIDKVVKATDDNELKKQENVIVQKVIPAIEGAPKLPSKEELLFKMNDEKEVGAPQEPEIMNNLTTEIDMDEILTFDSLLFDEQELEKPAEEIKEKEEAKKENKEFCDKTPTEFEDSKESEEIKDKEFDSKSGKVSRPHMDPYKLKYIHRLLEELERSGEPYTPKDVVKLSKGAITQDEVKVAMEYFDDCDEDKEDNEFCNFDDLYFSDDEVEDQKKSDKEDLAILKALIKEAKDKKDDKKATILEKLCKKLYGEKDFCKEFDLEDPKDMSEKSAAEVKKEAPRSLKDIKDIVSSRTTGSADPTKDKAQMIKELNKKNSEDTLLGIAKANKDIIK